MSTTLLIPSFSANNIKERTSLTAPVSATDDTLTVQSTQGYNQGDIIYIGELSREGIEKAVISAVTDATTLTLESGLELPHGASSAVTSVVGDTIRIYRATNVDGKVPADEEFSLLATRSIDPDQQTSYYRDSDGNSGYWYRFTYYNAETEEETALSDSVPVRGDDFGHYASLTEIRREAGFENAHNLKDTAIDQQRRAAEAEINSALANKYSVPFTAPVPEIVNTLTIKLAAGMLLQASYGEQSSRASMKLKEARDLIKQIQESDSIIQGSDGGALVGEGVSFWPDESAPRAFRIGETF